MSSDKRANCSKLQEAGKQIQFNTNIMIHNLEFCVKHHYNEYIWLYLIYVQFCIKDFVVSLGKGKKKIVFEGLALHWLISN